MGCNVSSKKISDAIENMHSKSEQTDVAVNLHDTKYEQTGNNQEFATAAGEGGANGQLEQQRICGTNLKFEWLYQKLLEIHKCNEAEPPWIAEVINHGPYHDRRPLQVVKVTLGWENSQLPTTVILKICGKTGHDNSALYKIKNRECAAYEWLANCEIPSVPKTLCIKALSLKHTSGVILMEDLTVLGQEGSIEHGLQVDVVMKLLKILAFIHAKSLESKEWVTTLPGPMTLQYEELSKNYERAKKIFLSHLDDVQLQILQEYFTSEYMLNTTVKVTKDDGQTIDETFLHGQLLATNVLFSDDLKQIFIVDWSNAHAGSIGEDLTMSVCWNLSPNERHQNLTNLIEHYSYHFQKNCSESIKLDIDDLWKLYFHFLPLAMSRWILMFANMDPDRKEMKAVQERSQALIIDVLLLREKNDAANKK